MRAKFITATIGLLSGFGVGTVVLAEQEDYQFEPIAFSESTALKRGAYSPSYDGGSYLSDKDACHLAVSTWGWENASCAVVDKIFLMPTPAMDTVIIEKPNSDGYVTFDDWANKDRDKQIGEIWSQLESGLKSQSEKLGVPITADKWFVYPTLNADKQYLYYATKINWNGEPTINVKASKFDRQGYVVFDMVPLDSEMTAEALETNVEEALAMYKPNATMAYSEFSEGDKIAAAGAVGVLATLVGVKFGKAAAVGAFALILAFAKKLWILIFIPLIALKNKIFKKKD